MKKLLLLSSVLAAFTLAGCSSVDTDPETSARYKNVSIIEKTLGVTTDSQGVKHKNGGIQISVVAYSSNAEIYTMVVPHGSAAPTNKELEAQEDYGKVDVLFSYSDTGSLYKFIDDSEFESGEKYDCYAVIKNDGKYSDLQYKTTVFTYDDASLVYKGEGTEKAPYEVHTIEDLEAVGVVTADRSNALEAHYKLMNNIDLSEKYNADGESWNPIGQVNGKRNKFSGVFDGDGFTINGLYQNTDIEGTGLFSELAVEGWITNLILTDVDIYTTTQRTAAVVGYCKGNVNNVAVLGGTIETTANRVGTIAGHMYDNGLINGAYADVDIISSNSSGNVGGIVGQASGISGSYVFSIKNSQFVGNINAVGTAGGIVGGAEDTIIENCIVDGSKITSTGRAAGLAGSLKSKNLDPRNCWNNIINNTVVTGNSNAGILFSDGSTTGASYSNNQYCNVTSGNSVTLKTGSYISSTSLSTLYSDSNLKNTLNYGTGMYTFRTGSFPVINIAYTYEITRGED